MLKCAKMVQIWRFMLVYNKMGSLHWPRKMQKGNWRKKMPPSDCINCCTRKFGMNSINHHFSFRDSSWLLVINWFVIQSMYNLQTQIVVYDRNHYFGLGLKPKPKLGDTFGGYHNQYQKQHLKRENLVTDSKRYFFLHKRAPKTKFSSKH